MSRITHTHRCSTECTPFLTDNARIAGRRWVGSTIGYRDKGLCPAQQHAREVLKRVLHRYQVNSRKIVCQNVRLQSVKFDRLAIDRQRAVR